MKAYVISNDEYCTIKFAEHRATAQSMGANELNEEFRDVTCHRAKEFDQYAEQKEVPWEVLIEEHGWSQECGYCYKRVYADVPERVYEGNHAYCSPACSKMADEQAIKYGLK